MIAAMARKVSVQPVPNKAGLAYAGESTQNSAGAIEVVGRAVGSVQQVHRKEITQSGRIARRLHAKLVFAREARPHDIPIYAVAVADIALYGIDVHVEGDLLPQGVVQVLDVSVDSPQLIWRVGDRDFLRRRKMRREKKETKRERAERHLRARIP